MIQSIIIIFEQIWNDVREDELWDEDVDCAQAGQVIGAIDEIVPAATLVAATAKTA